MHNYNHFCKQAHEDKANIVQAWQNGSPLDINTGIAYLVNSHLCKDTEMAHYWKHYNETYRGAVYPDSEYEMGRTSEYKDIHHMTEDEACAWVACMKNSDGTFGEHWNMETTTKVMKQEGIDESYISPLCFYVALNKVYSDGYTTAKTFNLESNLKYYIERVKEMVNDEDSVNIKERLAIYYNCIRKK